MCWAWDGSVMGAVKWTHCHFADYSTFPMAPYTMCTKHPAGECCYNGIGEVIWKLGKMGKSVCRLALKRFWYCHHHWGSRTRYGGLNVVVAIVVVTLMMVVVVVREKEVGCGGEKESHVEVCCFKCNLEHGIVSKKGTMRALLPYDWICHDYELMLRSWYGRFCGVVKRKGEKRRSEKISHFPLIFLTRHSLTVLQLSLQKSTTLDIVGFFEVKLWLGCVIRLLALIFDWSFWIAFVEK